MEPQAAVEFFRERFQEQGALERAAREKAYLKSPLQFHGVAVPDIRRACADFLKTQPVWGRREWRALADALYRTDFHDLRSAGIGLLERRSALLTPEDVPWLVQLVRRSPTWAHVDGLATKVFGPVVEAHPALRDELRVWAQDPDFWVRRTALLTQLDALRSGGGDFGLFEELAAPMLPEKEFFIRKAIGWVLRDVSRKRPELTYRFLLAHREQLSGLTLREGAKHLPPKLRATLGLATS